MKVEEIRKTMEAVGWTHHKRDGERFYTRGLRDRVVTFIFNVRRGSGIIISWRVDISSPEVDQISRNLIPKSAERLPLVNRVSGRDEKYINLSNPEVPEEYFASTSNEILSWATSFTREDILRHAAQFDATSWPSSFIVGVVSKALLGLTEDLFSQRAKWKETGEGRNNTILSDEQYAEMIELSKRQHSKAGQDDTR